MKLNLGENIRKYRKVIGLTQEQLADRLGVSCQSVSRWECGDGYPDMEHLPALAGLFGVTYDQLLADDREDQLTRLQELFEQLESAAEHREDERAAEILRTIHRNMSRYAEFGSELARVNNAVEGYGVGIPDIVLAEFRRYVDELQRHVQDGTVWGLALRTLAALEDDEHIDGFLKTRAAHIDLNGDELLRHRYFIRGETEKLSYMNQLRTFTLIHKLFDNRDGWKNGYAEENGRINEKNLAYLHSLHDTIPDPQHPVSGDGGLDLWADVRLELGFRQAAHEVHTGRTESAFVTLEDCVNLLERFMNLRKMKITKLTSTSSLLPTFSVDAWTSEGSGKGMMGYYNYGILYTWLGFVSPLRFLHILDQWTVFDPIREEPRFADIRSRVEEFTVPQ